jgi:hypothetical protein
MKLRKAAAHEVVHLVKQRLSVRCPSPPAAIVTLQNWMLHGSYLPVSPTCIASGSVSTYPKTPSDGGMPPEPTNVRPRPDPFPSPAGWKVAHRRQPAWRIRCARTKGPAAMPMKNVTLRFGGRVWELIQEEAAIDGSAPANSSAKQPSPGPFTRRPARSETSVGRHPRRRSWTNGRGPMKRSRTWRPTGRFVMSAAPGVGHGRDGGRWRAVAVFLSA